MTTTTAVEGVKSGFGKFTDSVVEHCSKWYNHTVTFFKSIPGHMKADHRIAALVFFVANIPILALADLFSKLIANPLFRLMGINDDNIATRGEKTLKHYASGTLIAAPIIFGLNCAVSYLLDFPLSKLTLLAITAASVFAKILFHTFV